MGLDMRPMGKAKPGKEKRFDNIFKMVSTNNIKPPSFIGKILGKKTPTKEELLKEWFSIQLPSYETIKAPKVGRDAEAEAWLKSKYDQMDQKVDFATFKSQHEGYYVIELAKEQDGVPVYRSFGQDENVLRGQFLRDCMDILGEELVSEAWSTKLAGETLDYGKRIMAQTNIIAKANNLEYLRDQRLPSDLPEKSIASKVHIAYAVAKWLIFYGKNGHGYEADY